MSLRIKDLKLEHTVTTELMLRSARSLAAQDFVECPPAVGMAINFNEADPWSEQRLPKRPVTEFSLREW